MPKITSSKRGKNAKTTTRVRKKPEKKAGLFAVILRYVVSVLIIAIIAFTMFRLLGSRDGQSSLSVNAIGSVLTPVQSFLTEKTEVVRNFFTTWHDYSALKTQNDELVRANTQLTLQLNDASEAQQENERLLSIVSASHTYDTLDPVYARVVARDVGQWFSTFSINCGSAQGVSNGNAVVNSDGLIGRVYEVGRNYSKVISIIDSRSGLACLVQRTRDNGIMRGGVTGTADAAKCYIYYLPNLNNIIPGDTVITSGTDRMYPKGLVIGTVSEISLDAGSEGSYAVLSPAADFLHIEEVLVLRTRVDDPETDEKLPSLPTPTPAPSASPSPTPDPRTLETPNPDDEESNWQYPTGDESKYVAPEIEMLPEDAWIDA